jgi:hypothetical protein
MALDQSALLELGCVKDLGRFLGLLIMQRLLRCGAR